MRRMHDSRRARVRRRAASRSSLATLERRRPRRSRSSAAGARRAKNFVIPTPKRFTLPERAAGDDGRRSAQVPEVTHPAGRAGRQRARGQGTGLARRSHRQHDARGHGRRSRRMRSRASSRRWAGARHHRRPGYDVDLRPTCSPITAPQAVQLSPMSRRSRGCPKPELARVKANMARDLAIQQEHAAVGRTGEVRRADLRRPSLRPALPDRGDARGLHARAGASLPPRSFQRRRARLYIAGVFDAAAMEASVRKAFDGVAARRAADRRRRSRRAARTGGFALIDRAGCAAVDGHARAQRARPVAHGLGRARGHRLAARRLLRLADHRQHPRAEGLHLLALQRARLASRRGAAGSNSADVTTNVTGAVAQGDLLRDRSPAERAAVGRRSCRASRTTWPASSSCRTPRAAA